MYNHFVATKTSPRVVCHFYRSETWRCEILDKHLTQLAARHIETRFIKINVANCPFICERLNIVVLPALVLTNNNVTAGIIEGMLQYDIVDGSMVTIYTNYIYIDTHSYYRI